MGDASEPRTTATEAHTVVSKKNAIVYNYVPWGTSTDNIVPSSGGYIVEGATVNIQNTIAGAVYLSQHMYEEHSTVVSTLCYGVQWDAVMNFVSDTTHIIWPSSDWGNYSGSSDFTTGSNENWQAKHIYDLAGNIYEWNMEADIYGGRVLRGRNYAKPGSAAYRGSYDSRYVTQGFGFRVTLYIKQK